MVFGGISIWSLILLLFVILMLVVIPVLVCGPVVKKAGYSRWWSVIMGIPVLNIIAVWVFAFGKWPVENA